MTTIPALPPLPRREGGSLFSSLVLVCLYFLLDTTVLASYGLLSLLVEAYRNAPLEVIEGTKCGTLLLFAAVKLLRDLVLMLRGRICWWEWPVSLLLFFYVLVETLILHVSLLD